MCDTNAVPGEYAELLLKFLPTKEEVCHNVSDCKKSAYGIIMYTVL